VLTCLVNRCFSVFINQKQALSNPPTPHKPHTSPTPTPHQHPQKHIRYEIFTCFLGKGDKETFAYGMAAVKESYYVIPTAPGSVGTMGARMGGRMGG